MNMCIIDIKDKDYPQKLREIKNPPQKLFAKGDVSILNSNSIAIIGSRNYSEYGKKVCEKFSKELSKRGICIVSGMAKGIDSIAHRACLNVGGKTIAVMGSGFNHIYPKENNILYKNIIDQGGAVITEYEEDVEPDSRNFPKRNRIVSGLSIGVLVIEAIHRSGTTITAGLAKEQGKKVFCVPNSIENIYGVGTNRLIKSGAKLVTSVEDILEEYNFLNNEIILQDKSSVIDKSNIKQEYRCVYDVLESNAMDINLISKKADININEVNYILTMLELEGAIKQLPGNLFKRI